MTGIFDSTYKTILKIGDSFKYRGNTYYIYYFYPKSLSIITPFRKEVAIKHTTKEYLLRKECEEKIRKSLKIAWRINTSRIYFY